MFSKSVDRHRAQKFLLERLKSWQLGLIFLMFLTLFAAFVFVGFVLDPQVNVILTHRTPSDSNYLQAIYDGTQAVIAEFGKFTPLNRAISVEMSIENRQFEVSSLSDFPLILNLSLSGLTGEEEAARETQLSSEVVTKSLSCDRERRNCDRISLFYEPVVRFPIYRVSIRFSNASELFRTQHQVGPIALSSVSTNMIFTIHELIWRNIFLVTSMFFLLAFLGLLVVFSIPKQRMPHRWATEQKWTAILLFGVILLNNPYFILSLFTSFIVLPIMDALFRSTFMALFMFALLVLTHCAVLPRTHKRRFLSFYLPKLCLVVTMWLIGVLTFAWTRINQLQDPAYSLFDQAPLTIAIQILFLVFFGGYICYLIVLIVTGLYRCCCDPHIPRSHKPFVFRRFTFLWLVTLFVILLSIIGAVMMVIRPDKAAEYLSFFALYNIYTYCLAVVFLPAPYFLKKVVEGEEEDLDEMQFIDLTENDALGIVNEGGIDETAVESNDIDEYLDDMGDSLRNRLEMMGGIGEDEDFEGNTPSEQTGGTHTTPTQPPEDHPSEQQRL